MYVIAYDIFSTIRLQKVAKLMESYGIRVQNSIFECDISESDIKDLRQKLKEILSDEDLVYIYQLTSDEYKNKKLFKKRA